MLAITFDIDWAPDEVVDYCVEKIIAAGVKATLFCTDHEADPSGRSSNLAERYKQHEDLLEFALHPNFLLGEKPTSVFERLLRHYPNAQGYRSHKALTSSEVLISAAEKGMRYESGYYISGLDVGCFFRDYNSTDIVQIPVFFFDRGYSSLTRPIYDVHQLGFVGQPGLRVLDFHPPAIYLNLDYLERYTNAKPDYHNPEKLWAHRNFENPGADSLLTQILQQIVQSGEPAWKMIEINNKFRREHAPENNPYIG